MELEREAIRSITEEAETSELCDWLSKLASSSVASLNFEVVLGTLKLGVDTTSSVNPMTIVMVVANVCKTVYHLKILHTYQWRNCRK